MIQARTQMNWGMSKQRVESKGALTVTHTVPLAKLEQLTELPDNLLASKFIASKTMALTIKIFQNFILSKWFADIVLFIPPTRRRQFSALTTLKKIINSVKC
jgi:hypothetical protein